MGRVIGIDLGTFNSCVAVLDGGVPMVIANRVGYQTMPSIVSVTEAGRELVGHMAKRQAVTNSEATVHGAKRLIGRRFSSPQVQRMRETVAYHIVEGPHDDPRIRLRAKDYSIPEISAKILREVKIAAEDYLGETVEKAVITVPAYFNDGQRQATKDAGIIAGLDVVQILNEPTSAALAYGFGKRMDRTLAVYDLGGGTFDISIMEISSSGVFKVIATAGDTFLGGDDFDQRIIDWLVVDFQTQTGIDLRGDRMATQRLKDAAETAKCGLSTEERVEINLPFLISDKHGEAVHFHKPVERRELEELTKDLVERTIKLCESTLDEAGLGTDEIEDVLLVGGMTRMPLVRRSVEAMFGQAPQLRIDPDLAVAMGAAVQGAALTDESLDMVLLDVTPHRMGITVAGGWMEEIIPQNSTVPIERTKRFTTTRDNQTAVKIFVVQGESRRADENDLIGQFELAGLRRALAGQVELAVSFVIDMDGILSVEAKNLETGALQSIQITASSGLTGEELDTMVEEARDHEVTRKEDEAFEKVREQAEAILDEIDALRPQVEQAVADTDYASSAVADALRIAVLARSLIEQGDTARLEGELPGLNRTLRLFRGAAVARS